MVWLVIVVIVAALLFMAWRVDQRDRKAGHRVRSYREISDSVRAAKQAKRDRRSERRAPARGDYVREMRRRHQP